MSNNISTDDILIAGDKYTWTKASEIPLHDFLGKYKPSMVQNDGTKPWIWVKGSDAAKVDTNQAEACAEAESLLKEVTEKVQGIQNDPSIPTRSNKKTGARSKKELREEAQSEATIKLKEISMKYGYVSGKWLVFAASDKVDLIWSNIATSLVSGPLSSTKAWIAKVSTSPENETPNYQHIICVYVPDVYDKEAVTEAMKTLLRHHGATLSGVKSDLYTAIGLDSKHPSGIPSTVWKNTALLKDTEIKELKEEFFSNLTANKTVQQPQTDDSGPKTEAKPKPKLKKKVKDNVFASDEEDQTGDEEKDRKEVLKARKGTASAKRSKAVEQDEEEEEEPRPKKTKTARK